MSCPRAIACLLSCLVLSCSDRPSNSDSTTQAAGLLPLPAASAPVRPKAVRGSLGAEVRVAGLMINGPTRDEFGGQPRPAFMGSNAGTRVALEIELPAGGIIDLDREASTLATFRDDRGTDLASAVGFGGAFEMLPQIAEDGRSVVVTVGAERLPAAGAGRLELQGTLVLVAASLQTTHVAEGVLLSPEQAFAAGPYTFRVTEAGASEWSAGWAFTVETQDDLSAVVSWTITDADGAEHEASPWMTASFNETTQQSLQCDQLDGPVTIALRAWSDARQVEVPFDALIGLGLK